MLKALLLYFLIMFGIDKKSDTKHDTPYSSKECIESSKSGLSGKETIDFPELEPLPNPLDKPMEFPVLPPIPLVIHPPLVTDVNP